MDERRRSDDFLLVLVLLAVGKALLTRWLVLGLSDPFISYAMEVAVIVVVMCTVDLIPRRRSVWLDLGAYLALVAVMYGNLLYASYFSELADPSMLQMAGQMGSVGDSVWELVRPIHMLYVVDVPFLLVAAADIAGFAPLKPGRSRTVAIAAVVAFGIAAVQVAVVIRTPSDGQLRSRPFARSGCVSDRQPAEGSRGSRRRGSGREPAWRRSPKSRRRHAVAHRDASPCRQRAAHAGSRLRRVRRQERLRHPGRVSPGPRVRRDHRRPGDHPQHQPHGRRQLGVLASVLADGRGQHRRRGVHRQHVSAPTVGPGRSGRICREGVPGHSPAAQPGRLSHLHDARQRRDVLEPRGALPRPGLRHVLRPHGHRRRGPHVGRLVGREVLRPGTRSSCSRRCRTAGLCTPSS